MKKKRSYTSYPKETKKKILIDLIIGIPIQEIQKKYSISNPSILYSWRYFNNKKNKSNKIHSNLNLYTGISILFACSCFIGSFIGYYLRYYR